MADITTACFGSEVYLFNEQWVVKGAEKGMKFGWHQDSGYIKFEEGDTRHKPYVTCWCTLDDVTEENGTVICFPTHAATHTILLSIMRKRRVPTI
jgi:ectoine hydroxylase-related dioxygenase (phytanoyl-CoA dioxygenase family)